MKNLVIAVDGSHNAVRAVAWVAEFCRAHVGVRIHVVNAAPRPEDWQTRGLGREPVEEHLRWRSAQAIEASTAPLREAGLPFEAVSALGDAAEVIASTARQLGCDAIVAGRRGLGRLEGLVLGSVSTKLLHLTELPVVLIR